MLHLWPIRFHIHVWFIEFYLWTLQTSFFIDSRTRDLHGWLSKWYKDVYEAIIVTLHDMNVYLKGVLKLPMTVVFIYEYWCPTRFPYYKMHCRLTVTRWVSLVRQKLKKPSGAPEFHAIFSEVHVARCLAFCVLWIIICPFAFFWYSCFFNNLQWLIK